MEMPSCVSYVLHTNDVIDEVTRSFSRSNIIIAITWSVLSYSVEIDIVIICCSRNIFLTH